MFLQLIVLFIAGFVLCEGCDVGQARQGCVIRNRACTCGLGCPSEFKYDTMQDCQSALKGKKKDICTANNPCMYGGSCIQITQRPGYKCRCEGTGYFGLRCSRACPVPGIGGRIGDIFPYECIVI